MLAIQASQKQEIASIREAARQFNVPYASLRYRLAGRINRTTIRANHHKLTESEEESLLRWILSIDSRSAAPRPAIIREIANILLVERCEEVVGEK